MVKSLIFSQINNKCGGIGLKHLIRGSYSIGGAGSLHH